MKLNYYNDKRFLAASSVRSCASYHAKTEICGKPKLVFRVNDCNKGALLCNEPTQQGAAEMVEKLTTLIDGAVAFRTHLLNNLKEYGNETY